MKKTTRFNKSYLNKDDATEILKIAEELKNSNSASFYNSIKKNSMDIKKDIIEHLWKVVISDNSLDQYGSNLEKSLWSYLLSDKSPRN